MATGIKHKNAPIASPPNKAKVLKPRSLLLDSTLFWEAFTLPLAKATQDEISRAKRRTAWNPGPITVNSLTRRLVLDMRFSSLVSRADVVMPVVEVPNISMNEWLSG